MQKFHIYIHFPYCLYKCHYCDFNSHAWDEGKIPHSDYVSALLFEVEARKRLFEGKGTHFFPEKTEIASLFFGGGTPSLMRAEDVEKIISTLDQEFTLAPNCEITLESNPGTVDRQRFVDFKNAGINRISMGVQSFQEKNLKRFGRIHSGDEAVAAINAALESGVERVSADLIFGFPGQSLKEWEGDLKKMLGFGLKHISCYALTAEPDTIYTRDLQKGQLAEVDADLFADMHNLTYELTDKAELSAYEISNFAADGEESRHNLGYWRYSSFLGLGAGAWSNFPAVRTMNIKAPSQYMQAVQKGAFFEQEEIEQRTAMTEYLMMGLRLKEGISHNDFAERFGESLASVFGDEVLRAVEKGWLEDDGAWMRATREGFLFNNSLVQMFM